MNDATQKLVDEAREFANHPEEHAEHDLICRLADALEAAQRPGKMLTDFKGDGVWRDETGTVWITQDEATDAVKSALAPPSSVPYVTDDGTLHRHSYGEECNYLSCRPVSPRKRARGDSDGEQ